MGYSDGVLDAPDSSTAAGVASGPHASGPGSGMGLGSGATHKLSERLWVVDAAALLLELCVVWLPLYRYLTALVDGAGARSSLLSFVAQAAPALIILAEVPWWIVVAPRRAALIRAMTIRNSGRPLPSELRRLVVPTLGLLPVLGLWLRPALLASSLGLGLFMLAQRGLLGRELAVLLGLVALGHSFCAGILRALWYERVLDLREARLFPDDDPIERLGRRYRRRAALQSLATGVIGLAAIAAYTLTFVPLTPALYASFEAMAVLVGGVLLGVWMVVVPRFGRPIDAYFDAGFGERSEGSGGKADEARQHALAAYHASVRLPVWYGLGKIASFWLAIGILLVLALRTLPLPHQDAALLGGAAGLITLAVALYETLVQRSSLRSLRVHLTSRHRLTLAELGHTVSLRGKMALSFGLQAVFVSALALFLSFISYRAFSTRFIQREADLRLRALVGQLVERSQSAPLSEAQIADELRRFFAELERHVEGPTLVYYPKRGPTIALGHSADLVGLDPPLPLRLLGQKAPLDLPSQRWSGYFTTLTLRDQELGRLVLLQPGYRGRGASTVPQLQLMIVIFLLMIAGALVVVVKAANELSEPLRTLEARAAALAAGELGRAVPPSGEADEVGRLTLLFEEMRRALNDRLRNSTEINIALEHEVQKRTAELAGRNEELRQTLDALRRAQDELVRSEKLASMGRLVAGIAHEINNPVNAIANTAGPLEQALQQLKRSPSGPLDGTELDEMLAMLSVIQRGARRTSEIVQALHSYSRRDDERIGEVDVNRLLDETLDLLRHQLKGITTVKEYQPQAVTRGNAGQLGQVFMNLITNAAQAIGESGVGTTVTLRTMRREGGGLVVEVADDGPGISDEIRQRIFDPFFTTKEVGKGSGLGLSIVQSLVDRHGGTISVESRQATAPGQAHGTSFHVELPGAKGPPPSGAATPVGRA